MCAKADRFPGGGRVGAKDAVQHGEKPLFRVLMGLNSREVTIFVGGKKTLWLLVASFRNNSYVERLILSQRLLLGGLPYAVNPTV